MTSRTEGIDPRGPRFGQTLTGSITLVAFLLDQTWLVAGLAVILGLGAVGGYRYNLWAKLYKHLVRPRLATPDEPEHPDPPRFAMCLGFVFLSVAAVLLTALAPYTAAWIGWTLVLVVSGLALLAAVTGLCVGCEIYVRIQRLRSPDRSEVPA